MPAMSLTAANRALDWLMGKTPAAPVAPLTVALLTDLGGDDQPGTEAAGGDYGRQTLDVPPAVDRATTHATDLVWTGLPECTIVGVAIWDSAETPVLLWQTGLDAPQTVSEGGELCWPAGSLVMRMG
ncbi:hypothetical protein [Streptomyces sp. NPDC059786]|uniref:phage tail fiber protein n=1 Tax=Streptomyces sp. NPDC059786 TaxID=3346946 RepID=UPI00365FCDD3